MANTCFYDIRIRGNKDGASYLCSLFDKSNSMENAPCIGRVYSADVYEKEETEGELYFAISGDCAWSVLTAMLDMNRENTLENVIKQYKLNVECYSEEPGIGFMEHFVWKDGKRVEDACEDFMECYVDDISEDEEYDANTVSGFITEILGELPLTGRKFTYKRY